MLTFGGLDQQQAAGLGFEIAGDHPRACTAWLTGTHAKMTAGADLHAGISVDQIAAREFGKETQLASLEIGLESPEVVGSCEAAYSCAYYNTISWRDETTPIPMENRPRALFERLFGAAGTTDPKMRGGPAAGGPQHPRRRQRGRQTAARKARRTGPRQDRPVSGRGARCRAAHPAGGGAEATTICRRLEGPGGVPSVFSDYFKLMADLMVLAWQTDMTRVCTFQMGHEMSLPRLSRARIRRRPSFRRRITTAMPDKIAKVIQINTLHTKMLAYYLDKLRNTPDGDGSLLDHSHDPLRGGAERRQPAPLYGSADPAGRRRRQRDQGRTASPLSCPARR